MNQAWKRCSAVASLALLLVAATAARGEARTLQTGGFAVELETVVPGSPVEAFDAFTAETLAWWDHHFSEQPRELFFEPRPGGGFVEIFDDEGNGALHATVIYAHRGKLLRFRGPLGFSGHALSMVHSLQFEPAEGGTRLKLTVHGVGELETGWADAVEQVWRHFLIERFKPHMESKSGT